MSWRTLAEHALSVTQGGASLKPKVSRVHGSDASRKNQVWSVRVTPGSAEPVSITLGASPACGSDGAMCTKDGRKLESGLSATVLGPRAVSVADARVAEGADATVDFAVTLSRAASEAVTVDYATSDGTAKAGVDYTAVSGTLTFAPGETEKTVSVSVLDDSHDEGEETFTLTLSNVAGGNAYLEDATATGTIENSDPMPRAWLVRFGRTVASQAVDAIGGRMEGGGTHVTVGGQSLALSVEATARQEGEVLEGALVALAETGDAPVATSRSMTGREVLLGSAFRLSAGEPARAPAFTAWGEFASGGFEADVNGTRMDGSVVTGFLGADVARARWLAGVALGFSEGEGGYALVEGEDRGDVESSLTALYPYARLGLTDSVDVWGIAGLGQGELTLTQHGIASRAEARRYTADISMRMGALGVRGEVVSPAEADGLAVAVRSDAFWVRTTSERVPGLMGSEGEVNRVRLVVESSRSLETGGGRLTPSLEVGLRHDGGDAETGTGVEVGAGLRYAGEGFSVEGSVRALLAHEASGYEEWGASGAMRIDPGVSGRGFSLTLAPTWGAASSGVERLWSPEGARSLAPDGGFEAARRLEAEVGYGLGVGGALGVVTPYAGVSFEGGGGGTVRTGARWQIAPQAALGLELTRTESAHRGVEAEHGVGFRLTARW